MFLQSEGESQQVGWCRWEKSAGWRGQEPGSQGRSCNWRVRHWSESEREKEQWICVIKLHLKLRAFSTASCLLGEITS